MKTLTPREVLTYSALLRLPQEESKASKLEKVEDVIDILGIRECADVLIGTPGLTRGISGGQRKRVNIGQEIITNPQVIFVDEPTSGLDSYTAYSVMKNTEITCIYG